MASGYTHCACRDCFEIVIAEFGSGALCDGCKNAGCEPHKEDSDGHLTAECQRPDAYGVEEGEDEV